MHLAPSYSQLRGDRARAVLKQILSADKLDEKLGVITAENLKALRGILTKGVDFSELVGFSQWSYRFDFLTIYDIQTLSKIK